MHVTKQVPVQNTLGNSCINNKGWHKIKIVVDYCNSLLSENIIIFVQKEVTAFRMEIVVI